MRSKNVNYLSLFVIAGLLGVGLLSGCTRSNLLGGMHSDGVESNSTVLTADGKAALARGDYDNAVNYFTLAAQHDPRNSEARKGFAEAFLKARHFNLAGFISTLIQSSGNTSTTFVNPADWGCSDYTSLKNQVFDPLVGALEPIILGHTDGPYTSTDVALNLNIGLFYILRADANSQVLASAQNYQVVQVQKSSTDAGTLNISSNDFGNLPNPFWWITNNGVLVASGDPTLAAIKLDLRNDVTKGLNCLQTAAAHSVSPKMITDLSNALAGLQTQLQ